jgi:hypothetical protein
MKIHKFHRYGITFSMRPKPFETYVKLMYHQMYHQMHHGTMWQSMKSEGSKMMIHSVIRVSRLDFILEL